MQLPSVIHRVLLLHLATVVDEVAEAVERTDRRSSEDAVVIEVIVNDYELFSRRSTTGRNRR